MITKLQVKYIQSLRQKKFRDQDVVFVAEGPKIINELLAAGGASVQNIYATRQWITANEAIQETAMQKTTVVSDQELERLSFLQAPNQVLAIFEKPAPQKINFESGISLMLDGIQDPGNMGTLIRIADWFGVGSVICSMDCADAFAPKVVQGSMGSIIRVNVLYTELIAFIQKNEKIQLYAATLHGELLKNTAPLVKGCIVIGNESKGISTELLERCRYKITIPRTGQAESLNAAVAAGIILSHLVPSPVTR